MSESGPMQTGSSSAWSTDGHVEVEVTAGRVTRVWIDPHWRAEQLEQVVERSIAEATNIALYQRLREIYELIYREHPEVHLSRDLNRAAAEVESHAPRGAELPGALRELGNLLEHLEDTDFQPDTPDQSQPPVMVDVMAEDSTTEVHVAGGQIYHLGLDPKWSRDTDEDTFLARVADLLNEGLDRSRDAQLEQILSTPSGRAGLASALWEANAYVVSAHLMDLDKLTGRAR